jgi:hypothetical protein
VLQGANIWLKAKFEANVSGSLGECKCSWELVIEVEKGSGKVLNNKILDDPVCTP